MAPQKKRSLKAALITDLHTGLPEDAPFNVDLRKNLTSILNAIKSHQPDELLIAGDLCLKEGNAEIYQWQKSQLDDLSIPYHIIAGNHDDVKLLSEVFDLPPMTDSELFFEKKLADRSVIFLDTSKARMSNNQKKWLASKLRNAVESRCVVVMHHPPDRMHVPHMDEMHYLKDSEEVMQILTDVDRPISIFCGHYHVEKTMSINQIDIHITPSCYFQIDAESSEFKIAHKQIAYRIIDFLPDRIEHSMYYLPGNEISLG